MNGRRIAQKILEDQGFVIMAFTPGPLPLPKVGEVITRPICGDRAGDVPGPFKIIGTATEAEYRIQAQRYCPWGLRGFDELAAEALGYFKLVAE